MDEAEREAVGLGARPVEAKNNSGPRDERTYSDPAGHSFTLAVAPEPARQPDPTGGGANAENISGIGDV